MPANARTFSTALLPIAAAVLTASLLAPAPAYAATSEPAPRMQQQTTLTAAYQRPKADSRVQRALSIMRAQQGDPYRYGAAGPSAFDCSGLVYYATHRAGLKGVPRTSSAQASYMRRLPKSAMRAGDFVFFSNGGRVYHVGVYVGGNRILHSPYSGTRVRIERIWTSNWFGGTLRGRR